ncbi:MAG: putative peptide transporter substrate-binding protein [Frankiales bacterium]|nr:putative peptide transporter substrate-binding protein [Frankiales bacterium]
MPSLLMPNEGKDHIMIRRPRHKRVLTAAAVTVLATVLSACNSGGGAEKASGPAGDNGTLNWEWDLPTSFDPVTSSAGWDAHVLGLAYSAITALDKNGNAVGGLAKSWKYAPDGKSIAFTLQPNLKFSDGTALDADAVKTNILRGRDTPDSRIASQLAEVTDVTVTSPTEFTIKLSKVDYQVPNLLAGKTGMIVSPTAIKANAAGLATKPVGDGPFTLTNYVPGSHADFVRNPNWFDASDIHLAKLSVKAITDQQQILAALQSGDVNVAYIAGSSVSAAKAAGFTINEVPSQVVTTLDVNTSKAPFSNPLVVQAINYAIDRQALVDTQQFGHGSPSFQPFPKNYTVGYDPSLANLYPHDVNKAKQLLAQAGYPNGLTIPLTTSIATGAVEQLQSQLKEAGITAKINVIPAAQFTNIVYIQKQPGLALDGTAGRESPLQMLEVLYDSKGLMNLSAKIPSNVQTVFDKLRTVPLDSPDYASTLQATVKAAVTSPGSQHIWLYTTPRILATSPKVTGLPFTLITQRFEGVRVAS